MSSVVRGDVVGLGAPMHESDRETVYTRRVNLVLRRKMCTVHQTSYVQKMFVSSQQDERMQMSPSHFTHGTQFISAQVRRQVSLRRHDDLVLRRRNRVRARKVFSRLCACHRGRAYSHTRVVSRERKECRTILFSSSDRARSLPVCYMRVGR